MRRAGDICEALTIKCRVTDYDWDFARDQAARIDAHWTQVRARKPALFDGRVLVSSRLDMEGDHLVGACFETGYRSFLSWRDFGFPGAPVMNAFAMPALRAADGAFMLGEMAASTANGGRLYFPAGTPEPADLDAAGFIDFDANILRELKEETGLRPDELRIDRIWTVVFDGPLVACMKVVQSHLNASGLQDRLATFNATQKSPELDRLVPVRGKDDYDVARMPHFMLRYLDRILGQAR